jgi:uncharacterized repeat protein (TIGR01451 family)
VSINHGPSVTTNAHGVTTFPAGFVPYQSSVNVAANQCVWNVPPPGPDPSLFTVNASGVNDDGSTWAIVAGGPPPANIPGSGAWAYWAASPEFAAWDAAVRAAVEATTAAQTLATVPGGQYVLTCEPLFPGQVWSPSDVGINIVSMWVPADTAAGSYQGGTVLASDAPETNVANNTSVLDLTVQHVSDTSVTKARTDPAAPIVAGQPVQYTLTVHNAGPSAADDLTVADTLPANMTFISATWQGGTACPSPEVYTDALGDDQTVARCTLTSLAPGATATAIVTLLPNSNALGQTFRNEAVVGSASLDPDALNNIAFDDSPAASEIADVSITKTLDGAALYAGAPATYRLTATNAGPSFARNVVISDPVPAGMTYSGFTAPAPVTCVLTAGIVTCTVPALSTGTLTFDANHDGIADTPDGDTNRDGVIDVPVSVTVALTFIVGADQVGESLSNTGTVTSPTDPTPGSAGDTAVVAPTLVVDPPDLAITLSPTSQTVASGAQGRLTATITNVGVGAASAVTARVEIPAGYTSYSGVAVSWPSGRAQPPDGVVGSLTFAVGDLAPGESVVYAIAGTVTGPAGANLVFGATVRASEPEAITGNNTVAATILVPGVGTAGPPRAAALSPTGANVWLPALIAVVLLAVGGVALAASRRGRHVR